MVSLPSWPAELDALAAAPEHHQCLFENDSVRVLETKIGPGQTVNLHTHSWPAAYYVLEFAHFIRRDGEGKITLDTRGQGIELTPGQAVWSDPLAPHTLENTDTRTLHIISVEIKRGG